MYYEYFGLRDAPFQFLPSDTLFLSAAHLEGLAALEWAFQEPSGLTLLVGEVGTGKTMLIHALVTRLNDPRIRIAQLSNPMMSFEEMLDTTVQQLRIHPVGKGKRAALQALRTFVGDPASSDRVILIFDEAQGLSNKILEELRLLSNSRPPQRHALQIILVGQPELIERLSDPKLRALNQRIGARALLRPLQDKEIGDYVNCLLRAQGAVRELFSPKAMDQIARLSGGLPRKINNLCHNALFAAYAEGSTVVQPRHVQAAGAEIDNLLDAASARQAQGWRGATHRMLGKGKPLMVGGILALALVTGASILEFGTRPPNARLAPAGLHTDRAPGASEFSMPPLASADKGHEQARNQPGTAAAMLSGRNTKQTAAPARPAPIAPAAVARKSQPLAPQPQPQATTGALVAGKTTPRPELQKAPASTNAGVPRLAAEPPVSNGLSYAQRRRLQYETRRARSSFQDGRYRNVIYHVKRALILDPSNSEMRNLLQRAEALAASPRKSASAHEEAVPAANEADGTDEGDNETVMPAELSTGSRYSGMVRYEISQGDAYMRAGKYDLALRKFLTASVLDPGNASLTERIERARGAKAVMEGPNNDSVGTSAADPDGVR